MSLPLQPRPCSELNPLHTLLYPRRPRLSGVVPGSWWQSQHLTQVRPSSAVAWGACRVALGRSPSSPGLSPVPLHYRAPSRSPGATANQPSVPPTPASEAGDSLGAPCSTSRMPLMQTGRSPILGKWSLKRRRPPCGARCCPEWELEWAPLESRVRGSGGRIGSAGGEQPGSLGERTGGGWGDLRASWAGHLGFVLCAVGTTAKQGCELRSACPCGEI